MNKSVMSVRHSVSSRCCRQQLPCTLRCPITFQILRKTRRTQMLAGKWDIFTSCILHLTGATLCTFQAVRCVRFETPMATGRVPNMLFGQDAETASSAIMASCAQDRPYTIIAQVHVQRKMLIKYQTPTSIHSGQQSLAV